MATQERLIIESMFRIADKEGNDVDFHLNTAQQYVDTHLTGRDIIPKARQEGVSSYFLGRNLAKCLSRRNERAVVISHEVDATQRMLGKVHYMIDNMKGASPIVGVSSKNEITFPKMNSTFYIGTAGSRKFGRGDTITSLHCSEAAFWDNPQELITGLFQAVPMTSGEISIESTGNGKGNWYHRSCMNAYQGIGTYTAHFLSWLTFDEYDLPITEEEIRFILENPREDMLELEYIERNPSITPGQLKFRRLKLEGPEFDFDVRKFDQEYPATLDDCFQSTGHSVFQRVNFIDDPDWKLIDDKTHGLQDMWNKPQSKYIIGVDVGAGVGKDDSVIEIFDLISMEQVAEWSSNMIDPDVLANHIKRLAEKFNNAFLVVESNNHGIATLKALKDSGYPRYLIFRSKTDTDSIIGYGYRTTAKTKPLLISEVRTALHKVMTIHSSFLNDQLGTFIETESGKLEAESGCKDDAVIAVALANIGRAKGVMATGAPHPIDIKTKDQIANSPFTLKEVLQSLDDSRKNVVPFPIKEQV